MEKRPCGSLAHHIRRAEQDDAQTLGAFRAESQAERSSLAFDAMARFRNECSSFFARELAAKDSFLRAWVALEGDAPVGAASLAVVPTLPRFAASYRGNGLRFDGRIRDVYVSPAHRRRGLGRNLMLTVIAESERLGIDRLSLGASAMGRALYLSLGFIEKPDEMVFVKR